MSVRGSFHRLAGLMATPLGVGGSLSLSTVRLSASFLGRGIGKPRGERGGETGRGETGREETGGGETGKFSTPLKS